MKLFVPLVAFVLMGVTSAVAQDVVAVDVVATTPPDDGSVTVAGLAPEPGYGYTEDQPVLIGGLNDGDFNDRLDAYFSLLRAANGEGLVVVLSKTCCSFETPNNPDVGFLQVYEVGIQGGKPIDIYVNPYDAGPRYMPHGMLAARSEENARAIEEALDLAEAGEPMALPNLQTLAEEGDMMAQYHLARLLADRRDFESAYPWFLRAAEAGHNVSQATVSKMLEEGTGIGANPALAQQWLRRAARNGHAGSRMRVALKLLSGPQDQARTSEGATLLHMAAQQGDPAAQAAYGAMLYYGRGVRRDVYQGLMWLYLAQRAGNRNANAHYPKVAAEQSQTMLSRVKLAAEDWLDRPSPPPVVPDEQIPDFY